MHAAFLVLASSRAGSADADRVAGAVAELATHAPTELAATTDESSLDGALDRCGRRTLVVAGGDGSVHTVVGRLRERGELGDATVAVVPLGTGNDLARGLGLPLDAVGAAQRIARGAVVPADLVAGDDGSVVVNAVHAGVGADAARRASSLKRALGPLAYPVGAAVAGVAADGWSLRVEVDGEVLADERLLMVGVGNGPTIGGGAPLHPAARVDDGRLDVVVVAATAPAGRFGFARALRRGRHLSRSDVRYAQGTVVRISGAPARHVVDGEVTEPLIERTYRVLPGAWRVCV